jgi:hypothetical protein
MKVKLFMNNLHNKMKYLLVLTVGIVSTSAIATPIFDFEMTGNTVYKPFSITNLSTNGEFIRSFTLDISGLGYVFDTLDKDGTTTYSKPFTANSGSGDVTGVLASSGADDNSTLLRAFFSDFNAGETFLFDIDVDLLGKNRTPIYGNQLIGSLLTVEFTDGMALSGSLGGVDNEATSTMLGLNGNDFSVAVNSPATLSLMALFPLVFLSRRLKNL